MSVINGILYYVLKLIIDEMRNFCLLNNAITLSSRLVQSAVRLVLPGELGKFAVAEGVKAVCKYNGYSMSKENKKRTTVSEKAGLLFSIGPIRNELQSSFSGYRFSVSTFVYATAVVEYIAAEILELAGNSARDNKRVRIIPRHIFLAIKNDEEFEKFFRDVIIAGGGALPNIRRELIRNNGQMDF